MERQIKQNHQVKKQNECSEFWSYSKKGDTYEKV
jgi:hypothetical protein